jgi:hypothetical protein
LPLIYFFVHGFGFEITNCTYPVIMVIKNEERKRENGGSEKEAVDV